MTRASAVDVSQAQRATLLERRHELARIESALADARSGQGRFVVVEGPAGIGKTALLTAARLAAANGGMRVLRARGTEMERDFAFGVVRQLFEPRLADASDIDRSDLLQGAAGVAARILGLPGAPAPNTSEDFTVDPSFAVLHGLYWLCANLAADEPLCLIVDDAHWMDGPSRRYLSFLLTRLDELQVALVLATRPCEPGSDAELLAALATDPAADLMQLPPLTGAAIAELVTSDLGSAPDPSFVDACLRATGGTPFLVRVLLDALKEGSIEPTADAWRHVERIGARTAGRSINIRLRRLPEPAGQLAHALALLEQSTLLEASQLAGLDVDEAADAAQILESAGILEPDRPLRFVHPLIRSGIYAELSPAERGRGHRRAAHILAEQPGTEIRVAQHLLLSDPAGDAWASDRLLAAAYAAGNHGAPESEAAFLRRALAEPPPTEKQPSILLDLGMAEASAGEAGWNDHLQQAVDRASDPTAAATAAMVLGLALSRAQRPGEAVEVLDRAAASLDASHSPLALVARGAAVFPAMNDPASASSLALRREVLLERSRSDPTAPREVLAAAAFISVLANDPAEEGAELATRALIVPEQQEASVERPWFSYSAWFSQITFALLWAEHYEEVRPLLDRSIEEAQLAGDSSRLSMGLANRSWLSLRRGDLNTAERDARTALAATKLPAPPMYRTLNGALLAGVLVHQGEIAEANRLLETFEEEIEGESLIAAVLRFTRGRVRTAQARHRDALDDFEAIGRLLTRTQVTCPGFLAWRSEAALAQLALGNRDSAQQLAEEELELARSFGGRRSVGVAARSLGIVTGGDQGAQLLREAIDAFDASGAKLERSRALADLGAMLRRRNRRTEARQLLREALDTAHRVGAARLAEYAEIELRATGARPRRVLLTGLESLTASEGRVAELASQGMTNREIAQSLFVTARTVEGHLTSIFRKLQLDSRNDLQGALAGRVSVTA